MGWNYSDKLIDLFNEALSGGKNSYYGTIDGPDGIGHYGSIACGDAMVFRFEVEKDKKDPLKDRIVKARYETFGCTSAIASSEALCYIIEHEMPTPVEALSITAEDIARFLEGMPAQKMHCSVMGAEVLKGSVKDWAIKRGVDYTAFLDDHDHEDDESAIICKCYGRSENYIKRTIEDLDIRDLDELIHKSQAGSSCGSCISNPGGLNDLLSEDRPQTTMVNRINRHEEMLVKESEIEAKVTLVLNTAIRPHLQRQGVDIEIVRIKGAKVYCQIHGLQEGMRTNTKSIEKIFRELVDPDITLIDF